MEHLSQQISVLSLHTQTLLYLSIGLVCFLCSIYYRCKVHLWRLQLFLCVVVWNLCSTFWCVLLVRFQMGVPMFPRSVAGNSLLLPDVLYGLVFNVIVCICLGPASGSNCICRQLCHLSAERVSLKKTTNKSNSALWFERLRTPCSSFLPTCSSVRSSRY